MTQTCVLTDGVEIEFLNRGLKIRPYEIQTRAERHKFSYSRVKVSNRAAELIQDYEAYKEPVEVSIGGILQGRYFVPADGVIYEDELEQAWVELLDPLKVLEDETISRSYNSITLEEIVGDIYSLKNDNNNVLTGFEVLNEQTAALAERNLRGQVEDRIGRGRIARAISWTYQQLGNSALMQSGLPAIEGGFDFDEATLYQALLEIEKAFGVVVWSDKNGVLCVGLPESRDVNAIAVFGDPDRDKVSISGFNVGTSRNSLAYLQARSTTAAYRIPLPLTMAKFGDSRDVHFVAEAFVPGMEGNDAVVEDPIRVRSQEEMEDVVRRKFIDAYMSHNSGNIEFNGLSSDDKTTLAQLTVGDYVGVSTERDNVCGRGIEGGRFIVRRVLHNINARVGWQITVEVSRMAPEPTINSVVYDYETDSYFRTTGDIGGDSIEFNPEV